MSDPTDALVTREMCPHCGVHMTPRPRGGLTRSHEYEGTVCPGSRQNPRSLWDRRFLWNGERPPPAPGDDPAWPSGPHPAGTTPLGGL